MPGVWEWIKWITYEAIWMFFIIAAMPIMAGVVLPLLSWVVIGISAIFTALIIVFVRRPQGLRATIRRDLFLKILAFPFMFLVVFLFRLFLSQLYRGNLRQLTWVPMWVIIAGVFIVLIRPLLTLVIWRIPEDKRTWRISAQLILLFIPLIVLALLVAHFSR